MYVVENKVVVCMYLPVHTYVYMLLAALEVLQLRGTRRGQGRKGRRGGKIPPDWIGWDRIGREGGLTSPIDRIPLKCTPAAMTT